MQFSRNIKQHKIIFFPILLQALVKLVLDIFKLFLTWPLNALTSCWQLFYFVWINKCWGSRSIFDSPFRQNANQGKRSLISSALLNRSFLLWFNQCHVPEDRVKYSGFTAHSLHCFIAREPMWEVSRIEELQSQNSRTLHLN